MSFDPFHMFLLLYQLISTSNHGYIAQMVKRDVLRIVVMIMAPGYVVDVLLKVRAVASKYRIVWEKPCLHEQFICLTFTCTPTTLALS